MIGVLTANDYEDFLIELSRCQRATLDQLHKVDMSETDQDPEPSTPVMIREGWRREYDRNTGNCDSAICYTLVWADGTETTTHTIPNDWRHLIVVDSKG